jgi:hypothetical protein
MAIGPGKYDKECVSVLLRTGAEAVVLCVLRGKEGSGFSCNARGIEIQQRLPELLRLIADEIEKDTK